MNIMAVTLIIYKVIKKQIKIQLKSMTIFLTEICKHSKQNQTTTNKAKISNKHSKLNVFPKQCSMNIQLQFPYR